MVIKKHVKYFLDVHTNNLKYHYKNMGHTYHHPKQFQDCHAGKPQCMLMKSSIVKNLLLIVYYISFSVSAYLLHKIFSRRKSDQKEMIMNQAQRTSKK